MSQWSTPSSGPLAPRESAETRSKARKVASQWPTLSSGPLAPRERAETESKARKRCEPVAHSFEWATSSPGKGPKLGQKLRKVVSQWTTPSSGPLAPRKRAETRSKARKVASQWPTLSSGPLAPREKAEIRSKARKNREPVDHSLEWTTSSWEKG